MTTNYLIQLDGTNNIPRLPQLSFAQNRKANDILQGYVIGWYKQSIRKIV